MSAGIMGQYREALRDLREGIGDICREYKNDEHVGEGLGDGVVHVVAALRVFELLDRDIEMHEKGLAERRKSEADLEESTGAGS